jgi:hypothetical protein
MAVITEDGDDGLTILDRVTAALQSRGEEAALEHTGGGIYCIRLTIRGDRWMYWGTADAVWGCDIYRGDYLLDAKFLDGVPVSADNIEQAASAIVTFTNEVRGSPAGSASVG